MVGLVVGFAALLVSSAENTPAPAPAPSPVEEVATPVPAPTSAPERKICRTEQSTYSRMAVKRICRTAAEWSAIDRGNARDLDTPQRRR